MSKGKVLSALVLGVMATHSLIPAAAHAGNGDHPEPYRMYWKPHYGWVTTWHHGGSNYWEREVETTFEWFEGIGLRRIDSPRTESGRGTYEHEVQFLPGNSQHWCANGPFATYTDLPSGSYYDNVGTDAGSYAWGMPGWRLVKNYLYAINFECGRIDQSSPSYHSYALYSQAGHCHCSGDPSSFYVYPDETNWLIPSSIGEAYNGTTRGFEQSHTGIARSSWEDGTSPWGVGYGSLSRIKDVSKAYHRAHLAKVTPQQGWGASLRYDAYPATVDAGTNKQYNEFVVRCPNYWNASNCEVTVAVKGYEGSSQALYEQAYTIKNDDAWKRIRVTTSSFSSGTDRWRFIVSGRPDEVVQVDYNQQYYLTP